MTTATHPRHEIHWVDWSDEAFERARRQDKLILLDSGATWCHWCHVMDHVTYEDPEVCELIEARFVPVRIDRDRRSELDAYLQRSVPVVRSQGGGWPLTVVLTPEGHVLFKATFLPPRADPRYGAQLGLMDVLLSLDDYWRKNRSQIASAGSQIRQALRDHLAGAYSQPGQAGTAQIESIVSGIRFEFDEAHGGFGSAPKFFGGTALELLLGRAWAGQDRDRDMALRTLDAIARGGVRDHVGGGFHRYSVDARWHVPHFEKMAYDNAALLGLYCNAYALTGRGELLCVARQSLDWIGEKLLANDRRGFYASQDADLAAGDDGDYFTWTLAEFRDALGGADRLLESWYDVDEIGDMHDRPGRNVLFTPKTLDQLARLEREEAARLGQRIEQGRQKLLRVRRQRPEPAVDKTVFADLNGMMIDAYLTAWERLGDAPAREAALAVLDRLLHELRDERGVFAHYRDGAALREIGQLADQAWMMRALLHAFAATADARYLDAARGLADYVLAALVDEDGAFMNAPARPDDAPTAVPPVRSWEDSPVRNSASVACQSLIDLAHFTDQPRYADAARTALNSLAGAVSREWGTFLGGYALAVEQLLAGPRTVIVAGAASDPATAEFARTARQTFLPGGYVIQIDPTVPEQAQLLSRLGYRGDQRPVACVCRAKACLAPAHTADELRERLTQLAEQR